MARPRQNLLFVDTETTGLDPVKAEIVEFASILTDPTGETVLERFETKAFPDRIQDAEPVALKINGYNEEKWRAAGAITQAQLAGRLAAHLLKKTIVGHHVSFDEGMISSLFNRHAMKPDWGYHKIDTASLAWPLFVKNLILDGVSLKHIAPFLGLPHQKAEHHAHDDVELCRLVYVELLKRYLK